MSDDEPEVGGGESEVGPAPDAPTPDPPLPTPQSSIIDSDKDVAREVRRLSRRGFIVAGVSTVATYGAWKWLRLRPREEGLEWPFRRTLETNEKIAEGYFRPSRLSPTFPPSAVTNARVNGGIGLTANYDPANWRLRVEGADNREPMMLTLDDIKSLPRRDMTTELRCIEGWSIIVHWTGVRLADLMAQLPPPRGTRYVGMETPDRGYYVGLDMQSAAHPQTLLAYELDGQPLSWQHGAPLRLAIPVKYGIKNIKRLALIRYTNIRPADFWAERGYDWYAGH